MTCVGIMTIATESASESEIENENQAEDQPSEKGNQNGNVNENENGIVEMNGQTPHTAQDTKKETGTEDDASKACQHRIGSMMKQ